MEPLDSLNRWSERARDRARVGSFWRFVLKRFLGDRLFEAAGALSYTTIFALVPLSMVVFGVLSAFPVFDELSGQLSHYIFSNFVPRAANAVEKYLREFSANIKSLTAAGTVALVVSLLITLVGVESTFNRIWRVPTARPKLGRFLVYWTVLTLGALVAAASLALSTRFFALSVFETSAGRWLEALMLRGAPMLIEMLAFASLFMGAVANPGFVHLSVLFSGEGFSAGAVAAIISGTGLMLTLGKLLYGETTDHVGGCKSTLLFGAILVAGHVLCCLAFLQSIPLSVLTAVCMGVGYPIATIGPSVWANDLASPRQYPTVLRRLQVIYAGGALVFATVPGLLADRFGDYLPAYILFSCLVLVSLLLIALSYRAGRKVRTEHKA